MPASCLSLACQRAYPSPPALQHPPKLTVCHPCICLHRIAASTAVTPLCTCLHRPTGIVAPSCGADSQEAWRNLPSAVCTAIPVPSHNDVLDDRSTRANHTALVGANSFSSAFLGLPLAELPRSRILVEVHEW